VKTSSIVRNAIAPHQMSARVATAEIAGGRLTSEALVRDCCTRIQALESVVRAWAHLDSDAAIESARQLDHGGGSGRLFGVPIGWKDIIDCAGMPTGCGSPIYRDHQAVKDAGAVAMSKRSGALVLGKTVTAEFAASQPGATTNPHNPRHTPGGSSSGSAAAVAAGMVPLALGTQTGGSVIRPASFCGVVGFKPSFGLISREGSRQLSDSLDTVGTFARSVGDTGLLVGAVTGRDEFFDIRSTRPRRVVLCKDANWDTAEKASIDALDKTLLWLSEEGVAVSEFGLPAMFDGMRAAHQTIEYFEIARALQSDYRCHSDLLSDALRSRVDKGLGLPSSGYEAALALQRRCQDAIEGLFGDADVLIAPSAPGEAPEGLTSTGNATFNRMWTALRLPCITLPGHRGPQGLPVGIQLIARAMQDVRLLAYAAWIEDMLLRRGLGAALIDHDRGLL
jgi:Asp-tRNA(Asn)/Glu-tRNA(Gln) amidotransferase A subunit family amidase